MGTKEASAYRSEANKTCGAMRSARIKLVGPIFAQRCQAYSLSKVHAHGRTMLLVTDIDRWA